MCNLKKKNHTSKALTDYLKPQLIGDHRNQAKIKGFAQIRYNLLYGIISITVAHIFIEGRNDIYPIQSHTISEEGMISKKDLL